MGKKKAKNMRAVMRKKARDKFKWLSKEKDIVGWYKSKEAA